MRANARRVTIALLVAGFAVALAACSGQEPPATEPDTGEAETRAPVQQTPPETEPPRADDWDTTEPTGSTLTPDMINSMDVLKRIHFDYDRSEIRADARQVLQDNAQWLRDNPGVTILIEGHADERGTREYNQALGERRAAAARDYMESLGVSADRIEIISYGEERPLAQGENEAAWQQNRRAEFLAVSVGS